MNENVVVKDFEFNNSPNHKIDSLIDNSIRDCHNKYFQTFDHICEYNLCFTNISINETVNFTISDETLGLFELNKKFTFALERGSIFNQINNFKIRIYINLSNINIHFHLLLGASPLHRHFFRKISQNRD